MTTLHQLATATKGHAPQWVKDAANISTRAYGMATAPYRPLPDFLVIGAKRGGTTSLYKYLVELPSVIPMFPAARELKGNYYFFEYYDRGPVWYRSHFATTAYRKALAKKLGHQPITGEGSPYYMYDPWGAEKISALLPDVKALVLLRDPVKRAYSHYWERVGDGVEPLTFREALAAEPDRLAENADRRLADPRFYDRNHDYYSYRDRGIYLPQLQRWFAHFPRERVLIHASEDLYRDEQSVLDQTCQFLGIPPRALPVFRQHNEQRPPAMDQDLQSELTEFYRPHNAALYDYLGRDFGWGT